jgi:hypothetical protein
MDKLEKKISDPFWSEDIEILFKISKLSEFFPEKKLSFSENLNSITRCSIYLSIIFYLYNGNYKFLFIFIITIILTYMIYHNNKEYEISKKIIDNYKNFGNIKYPVKYINPSKNNPFMNVLLTDYIKNPNRDSIINKKGNNIHIKQQIEDKFNLNLYKDVSDIFGVENSQRQYYTTPITTIPNDQSKFAKWLYNVPKTCKEGNGTQCVANNYTQLYSNIRGKYDTGATTNK